MLSIDDTGPCKVTPGQNEINVFLITTLYDRQKQQKSHFDFEQIYNSTESKGQST